MRAMVGSMAREKVKDVSSGIGTLVGTDIVTAGVSLEGGLDELEC